MKLTKCVTVCLTEEDYLALKRLSKEKHKTVSELIRESIKKFIKLINCK